MTSTRRRVDTASERVRARADRVRARSSTLARRAAVRRLARRVDRATIASSGVGCLRNS